MTTTETRGLHHQLKLPELPEPAPGEFRLRWEVSLDGAGLIVVRLVEQYQTMPSQTVFRFEAGDQLTAESKAKRAWSNYRAVHGGAWAQ